MLGTQRLLCLCGLIAFAAQGAVLEIKVPPSSGWVEETDPNPPDTDKATSRFFRRAGNEALTLRVVKDPRRRFDYLKPVVAAMGEQLARQGRGNGRVILVKDLGSIQVEGAPVGRLLTAEGEVWRLAFDVPADDGDLELTLSGPKWEQAVEDELVEAVTAAKGLRHPDVVTPSPTVDMGKVFLSIVGVVFAVSMTGMFLMLRRKRPPT